MKADGPVKSITLCHTVASPITNKVSDAQGVKVARTSLKYRNQNNKPDAWEESVLKAFEQRKANGEAVDKMEFSEVSEVERQAGIPLHEGHPHRRCLPQMPRRQYCRTCCGRNKRPVSGRYGYRFQ